MLYWTGIREGELLALSRSDFDFKKGTVTISKSYQRLEGKDVITDPKTVFLESAKAIYIMKWTEKPIMQE